jgi:hypothetical protein
VLHFLFGEGQIKRRLRLEGGFGSRSAAINQEYWYQLAGPRSPRALCLQSDLAASAGFFEPATAAFRQRRTVLVPAHPDLSRGVLRTSLKPAIAIIVPEDTG